VSSATDREPSEPARSGLDQLLDMVVYGPVGIAMEARHQFPRWADEGRRQLGNQLNMARAIGRLAVDQGARQGSEALRRLTRETERLLAALGLVPERDDLDEDSPESQAEPGDGSPSAAPVTSPLGDSPPGNAAAGVTPTGPAGTADRGAAGQGRTGLDPAELAIPGYDTLSASQIVQRLPGLSAEELEAVRVYEVAGRGRKTVLLRVAQLRAPSSRGGSS
jgi:hypothetical protein